MPKRPHNTSIEVNNSSNTSKEVNHLGNAIKKCKGNDVKPDFITEERTTTNIFTGQSIITTYIKFLNVDLIASLKKMFNNSSFYDAEPSIEISDFLTKIPVLRKYAKNGNIKINKFLIYIENYFKTDIDKVNKMISNSVIDYGSLWYLFTEGTEVLYEYNYQKIAGVVTSVEYSVYYLCISVEVIIYLNTKGFTKVKKSCYIEPYNGTKDIMSLAVSILNNENKQELKERGTKYKDIVTVPKHMYYNGPTYKKTYFGTNCTNIKGRVMVDTINFCKYNPNNDTYNSSRYNGNTHIPNLLETDFHLLWPFIPGYSLTKVKQWTEFAINYLKPIVYNNNAFDYLEMPEGQDKRKELIMALIKNRDNVFTDIIDDKSGGLIFLLHGPPGVGKTLTAEATAEILHVPLYSITVGELGTDIAELETNLNNALELGQSWNAVILLDEADIFLEHRDTNNIVRNAMVGIFLRLLEYHNGIIFLTTNRVKNLDEAAISRMSMIFNYPDLSEQTRIKIWTNLLKASNNYTRLIDVSKLSGYKLNGRQIKSTIRLAQSYAISKKETLETNHIENIINLELESNNLL
jgi:hypothetical protein